MIACSLLSFPLLGQVNYAPQGGEFAIAGALAGDQVFPDLSVKAGGGFLVWQDNATDGSGLGISARRLDGSLSGTLSSFRVNEQGAQDQQKPRVALLANGGAVFVWQGGRQGFQRIYARFLSASNTWATGDVLVNTFTNNSQLSPAVAVLADGNVVIAWSSFDQEAAGSYQGVYAQRFSPGGAKLGGEFLVNQTTAWNQRLPAVAALSDGRFVVAWVSEQQRFENGVDIYGRLFSASGSAAGGEFLINTSTNITGHPSVAAASDGSCLVAWSERDLMNRSNSWDVVARPISSAGVGGAVRRVNTMVYGDQIAPRVSAIGTDYLVVWMSLGQDGSREGVYGQVLRGDGSLAGSEFRVNSTTVSQQMHPAVASDGLGRFLVVWTSFVGGLNSFDLYAQRYATDLQPLPTPAAPFVTALSSSRLMVTWPVLQGFSVSNYLVYADGAGTASASVTENRWTLSGLNPNTTHTFRLGYVLTDGRVSPLSESASGMTWGWDENLDGLPDDWQAMYWGPDANFWPSPFADSDGDGVNNRNEFLAGTDPTDANSVLRIRLQASPQGLYLNWNTEPGLIYQVQTATSMGSWTNVGGPRFAAGRVDSLFVGGGNFGYYRVVRLR